MEKSNAIDMDKRELLYKEMKGIIDDLQHHWKEKTEKEVQELCKKMGKIARGENAWYRADALSNPNLPQELLRIGDAFNNNLIILRDIIISIDEMNTRYGLIISDDIFLFLLKYISNKKVAFFIAAFITTVPQFKNYENKWDYILSIPNMTPKKDSIDIFRRIINKVLAKVPETLAILTKIPETLKNDVIKVFQDYLDKNPDLHQYTKEEYEEIIKKLKQ